MGFQEDFNDCVQLKMSDATSMTELDRDADFRAALEKCSEPGALDPDMRDLYEKSVEKVVSEIADNILEHQMSGEPGSILIVAGGTADPQTNEAMILREVASKLGTEMHGQIYVNDGGQDLNHFRVLNEQSTGEAGVVIHLGDVPAEDMDVIRQGYSTVLELNSQNMHILPNPTEGNSMDQESVEFLVGNKVDDYIAETFPKIEEPDAEATLMMMK